MTAVLPTAAPAASPAVGPAPSRGDRVRWSWRLIRRPAALIWLTAFAYMAMEVLVFRSAYPDAASRAQLRELSTSTAVRMLQGVPGAVDTAGGYAVWDGGWMLSIIVGCWALLAATRLTRGEEDAGRAELVLARPLTARQALGGHLAALAIAAAGAGVASALPFVLLGEPLGGALLWGAGLAGFCAAAGALGALAGQVLEPRRRAVSYGLGLIAGAYLLRVVANSAPSRSWLLALGPFGWTDRQRAFGDDRWWWLLAPLTAAVLLAAAALAVCARRDAGVALWQARAKHRSDLRLLHGATAFGWRITAGALAAWTVALAVVTFVFGLMTGAIVDFIQRDDTYRRMLRSMGMDMSAPAIGYVSYIATFLALPFATFLGFRIGATWQEEAEGRLDNLLVRGVVRRRWLAGTAASAVLAALVLVAASTVSAWAGAALVDSPVATTDVIEPMVGTVPLIVLFAGLAVLVYGLVPRLTAPLTVTLAVLCYLLDTFGALLKWPDVVLGISPFHHLARLPGSPMTGTATLVMVGLGLLAAAGGVAAFARRDLHGA